MIGNDRQVVVLIVFCVLTTVSAVAVGLSCPFYFNSETARLSIVSATRDGEALDLETYETRQQEIRTSLTFECFDQQEDPDFNQILLVRSGSYSAARFEHERCLR